MSTFIQRFSSLIILIPVIFLLSFKAFSQDVYLKIKVLSSEKSSVKVEGKFAEKKIFTGKNWSFLKSYADAENLGKRIKNFKILDAKGSELPYRKFDEGEFVAEAEAGSFSYEADLSIPANKSLMAHISWVDQSQAMLMLNDLLPQFGKEENLSAQIKFELPETWQISTGAENAGNGGYRTDDLENAVFLVGKSRNKKLITVQNTEVDFVISGEWLFEESEAAEMAQSILKEYAGIFGEIPFEKIQIFLIRFPKEIEAGRWRAETRGANAVIVSSSMPFKSQAIQRLHEQLRHELFHFWIPNSLNLSGDYAWFYEGFAVYQALKTGVWLGQIRFEDFLNTISESYNILNRAEPEFSLIDISKHRWQQGSASVYSKGLLVAFLCDLAILEKSKGKQDLKKVFLKVFEENKSASLQKDANESILQILSGFRELNFIVEKHIKGTEKIDLANYLTSNGIENTGTSSNAKFKLKTKLRGREKAILEKLGYNRWREILRKS